LLLQCSVGDLISGADMIAVARESDIPIGTNRAFDVNGTSVLIARTGHGIFAVENQCSHAFQSLEGGKMRGIHIFCPLHGVRFDLRDGSALGTLTRQPIRTWATTVVDGMIMVEGIPA
jgi:3-phenylpropionate/trans-cinnamate dioxygenase ferredoxin component